MLNMIAAGSMALSLLAPMSTLTAASTDEVTAPEGVSVDVVTVNGSGCPAGWGVVTRSSGGTSFEITSPAYFAWAGGDADPTEFRRNCQISMQINKPQGLTYAVAQIESSGFAHLAPGASGVSRVSFYFQGMSPTTALSETFTGPMSGSWQTAPVVDSASLVYAPCDVDRNLNINTELRVSAGTSDPAVTSFMVRDPVTAFRLTWKRCIST